MELRYEATQDTLGLIIRVIVDKPDHSGFPVGYWLGTIRESKMWYPEAQADGVEWYDKKRKFRGAGKGPAKYVYLPIDESQGPFFGTTLDGLKTEMEVRVWYH